MACLSAYLLKVHQLFDGGMLKDVVATAYAG